MWLFLQYSRWTLLINYQSSGFAQGYWKKVHSLFVWYEFWESSSNPPQGKLEDLGLTTSNFISNSEEILVLLAICLTLPFLLYLCVPREKANVFTKSIIGWAFLVSFTDILMYAMIQFKYFAIDSIYYILNVSVCLFLLSTYTVVSAYTVAMICKGNLKNLYLLTAEFRLIYMYYPLIVITRGFTVSILVFVPDSEILQYSCVLSGECLVLLYLMITIPYHKKVSNILGILYHIIQVFVVSLPFLSEKQYIGETDLGLVLSVGSVFLLCLVRGVCDCRQSEVEMDKKEAAGVMNGNSDVIVPPKDCLLYTSDAADE